MKKILKRTASHWDKVDALYDEFVEQADRTLGNAYQREYKILAEKIKQLYFEIQGRIEAGTMIASDIYNYDRYYKLLNEINEKLKQLGFNECEKLEREMFNFWKEQSKLLEADFKIPPVSDELIKRTIGQVWVNADNLLYSDRIWKHLGQLEERLSSGLVECVTQGRTADSLTAEIKEAFNVSWNQSRRIVRTELSHIQTVSHLEGYKEANIEYYKILVSDLCPCPICSEQANRLYRIDEQGPPWHPNCRCIVSPVLRPTDEELKTRTR